MAETLLTTATALAPDATEVTGFLPQSVVDPKAARGRFEVPVPPGPQPPTEPPPDQPPPDPRVTGDVPAREA
jgi:hypothetical protein